VVTYNAESFEYSVSSLDQTYKLIWVSYNSRDFCPASPFFLGITVRIVSTFELIYYIAYPSYISMWSKVDMFTITEALKGGRSSFAFISSASTSPHLISIQCNSSI
jgi:hypothetical protein